MMKKKRHHYVPKSYLKSFCNDEGMVYVYRKDDPDRVFQLSPDNVGFHKYYYSQPTQDGGQDHNKLEDAFSTVEEKWPGIVDLIKEREVSNNDLEDLMSFIALQRVRVPACRDFVELMLAEKVKATAKLLDEKGKLPPKPKGCENILDLIEVSIDPHQSLLAMANLMVGLNNIFERIGIGAFFNKTQIPYLTSDNPVIWFDPSIPELELNPYNVKPNHPIVFLFPVSPEVIIYGTDSLYDRFMDEGFLCGEFPKQEIVEDINRKICQFSYRAVFSNSGDQKEIVAKYADKSPVLKTETIQAEKGVMTVFKSVFGKIEKKPKWKDKD